ncbi:hypothetical protein D9M71_342240 [compost metagenome]
MNNPQRDQRSQRIGLAGQARSIGPGRQQQDAGAHLNQCNQVRWRAGQALDDQRRHGIQERRTQGQADPQQIVIAAAALAAVSADNRQHPGKRQRQPEQLLHGDLLTEKHCCQPDQHERLDVVHRRTDGNRSPRVGGEQQHPVADDRHTAEHRQGEGGQGQNTGLEKAHGQADQQQGASAKHTAPEHHIQHRLPGHQHKPANSPRDQHRGDHFQRTTAY